MKSRKAENLAWILILSEIRLFLRHFSWPLGASWIQQKGMIRQLGGGIHSIYFRKSVSGIAVTLRCRGEIVSRRCFVTALRRCRACVDSFCHFSDRLVRVDGRRASRQTTQPPRPARGGGGHRRCRMPVSLGTAGLPLSHKSHFTPSSVAAEKMVLDTPQTQVRLLAVKPGQLESSCRMQNV